MQISTFKYYFFICHFTIKNVLIDTGSPSNMPVTCPSYPTLMYMVPRAHGHLLYFFKIDFLVTSNMNACIVLQSDISLVQCYLLVDDTLMCYKNI